MRKIKMLSDVGLWQLDEKPEKFKSRAIKSWKNQLHNGHMHEELNYLWQNQNAVCVGKRQLKGIVHLKNNIHPSSLNETNEPIFEFEDGRMKEYDELLNDLKKSELDL